MRPLLFFGLAGVATDITAPQGCCVLVVGCFEISSFYNPFSKWQSSKPQCQERQQLRIRQSLSTKDNGLFLSARGPTATSVPNSAPRQRSVSKPSRATRRILGSEFF